MALFGFGKKSEIPDSADALPGRAAVMKVPERHFVNGNSMAAPFPEHLQQAMFGLGCFWGAERKFWTVQGVYSTAVGYAGGFTPNATYDEVCSGGTGHNEVVLVIFDPAMCSYDQLLTVFWEAHNPTQGMRQGNDAGTQYRSGIYAFTAEQQMAAERSLARYQPELTKLGLPDITTEVITAPEFYYAEEYHQQYLAKNPAGYCGIGGTGACLPPEQ